MSESKAKNNKKNKKKKSSSSYLKGVWLWPIAVAMGLIPCIVRAYMYDPGFDEFDWYPTNAGYQMDFFMFGKMVGVIVMAAIMLLLVLWRLAQDKHSIEWKKPFFLMVGYSGFVLLSFLFSPYKSWASGGAYEVFESVWAVLGYVVILFYTYVTVNSEIDIIKILSFASIGVGIVYVIGIFQYIGLDFFKSDFGKALMLWPDFWEYKDGLSFTFAVGQVYTTLYNVDFLALFVGAWFPIFVFLTFLDKKLWKKIMWGFLAAASPIMIKGSGATTGAISILGASVVVIVIILSRKKAGLFVGAGLVVVVLAAGITYLNLPAGESLRGELTGTYKFEDRCPLTNVVTGEDEVLFETKDQKLHMTMSYGETTFYNDDGTEVTLIPSEEDNNFYTLSNAGVFDGATVQNKMDFIDNGGEAAILRYAVVNMLGTEWTLSNELGDGSYRYRNAVGKWVTIAGRKNVSVFYEDLYNGRGPIWNRALYTLKDHIFLGAGANTYMIATPQDDYVYENYNNSDLMYDVKGHSWYVTMAVEEGVIALLLFLAFYVWYAIRAIKLFRKGSSKDTITWLVLALFAGTLTYLISAIPNDSTVNTGIVFWVMLGLGLAANRIAEEKQKKCLEDAQSN